MKKVFLLLSIAVFFAGCGNKTEKTDEGKDSVVQEEVFKDVGPSFSETIDLAGEKYAIDIKCAIDPQAAKVIDNVDNKFYDNAVTVTIKRDGADFYNYVFHKSDFAPYIKDKAVDKLILQGMNYMSAENAKIRLSAGVGEPGETEGSSNFCITVFSDGHHEIEVDLTQNESGDEPLD